ncbi:MAG: hypothetical protein KQJ78_01135 [Deltaproteobacteria bacterium]|nr:hypothetical protein [Deltaproteobacteria bacterium]
MTLPTVEDMIPHRGRLKLLERVVETSRTCGVSWCRVRPWWPLFREGAVHALLSVELIAQTTGLLTAWGEPKDRDGRSVGLLVGIKEASFSREFFPEGLEIVARVDGPDKLTNYGVFEGRLTAGDEPLARVLLQIFRLEPEA